MKRIFRCWPVVLFLLAGCIQSSEHLTIERSGSGTLEVHLMVPEATRSFIDSTLGGMMQGMAQGMAQAFEGVKGTGPGAKANPPKMPNSVSEEMFGNKEDILKKAEKVGLKVEFVDFKKEVKDKDLYVSYKLIYDDINKLMRSRIVNSRFSLIKDPMGNLVFFLERDSEKAKDDKEKAEQFKKGGVSGEGDAKSKEMVQKMTEAMSKFKMEFSVTMPNKILNVFGPFEKLDERTAGFSIAGNILEDPTIIDKANAMAGEVPKVSCDSGGLTFEPDKSAAEKSAEAPSSAALAPREPAAAAPSVFQPLKQGREVTLELSNGLNVTGKIVDKNDDVIKVECAGVPVSYFKEEVICATQK